MAKRREKNILVALDIGNSKVAALVGEVHEDGRLEIVGFGAHPSKGLKRGVVVNIDATIASIQRAVEEAELMTGYRIHSAYTGIAGNHVQGLNSHGIVAIKAQEVTEFDIERVLDAAKAVAIPADQQILHVLPQEFIIDNQRGIREPIGMSGVRLESRVHMVVGSVSAAQNIIKCVQRCGLEVADIILEQVASSYAVLTEDEKELGVALIDMGGGTCDIAVYADGAILHTAVIPIAGDQVTNDIAVALRIPTPVAEELKLRHACTEGMLGDNADELLPAPPGMERFSKPITQRMISQVVEPRYEELFSLVQAELIRAGVFEMIPAGVVLTGGAAKMPGLIALAEDNLQLSVRLGKPLNTEGIDAVINDPIYATGVGLLHYGLKHQHANPLRAPRESKGMLGRMRQWFQGQF